MNVCGIVAEYNPFHLGHASHIAKTRQLMGSDCNIVCTMSGNYVQRGDFAVMNKHARAKAAVLCGADLVFELPTPYAVSSAEGFAKAAVSLLDGTGVVNCLSFGSEAGDIGCLRLIADALLSDDLRPLLQEELQSGMSFAKARQNAVSSLLGPEKAALLSSPNNILGVEYLKALTFLSSRIEPLTVARIGARHDAAGADGPVVSASYLRSLLKNGESVALSPFMPPLSFDILREEIQKGTSPVFLENADRSIVSFLKRLLPEDYLNLPDVSEGLEKRLYSAVLRGFSFDRICELAKTKRYAHSRIRRILLSAYLGISKELSEPPPPYLRVLAFNARGQELLKQMKKRAGLPIVVKPAHVKTLSANAIRLFELERTASALFCMASPAPENAPADEYRQSPVLVP